MSQHPASGSGDLSEDWEEDGQDDDAEQRLRHLAAAGRGPLTEPPGSAGVPQGQHHPAPSPPQVPPLYPTVQDWVEGMFARVVVRRATPEFRWCAQWWRHAEAIMRLEALWRSWETLRSDHKTGLGIWLREYLDAQLPQLTGAAGPFADCNPTRHHEPESRLVTQVAPADWWPAPPP